MAAIFYQRNNSHKRLFSNNTHQFSDFILILSLSIVLMVADYRYGYLNTIRNVLLLVVAPIQHIVDYPLRVVNLIQSIVSTKKLLIDENIKLHYQHTMLSAELQKLTVLKEENSQLKQLLLTSTKTKIKAMAAQILSVDVNSARQMIILDKGSRDDVYVGQPVLDSHGVMGQITDVGYITSTVLLISDAKCAVPVRNNRTGERAILVGTNNIGQLSLINLPHTVSIAKGDLLVTSGLGRLYPEGYPVGYVNNITNISGENFIKVDVAPVALLNRNHLVLLIWPDKQQIAVTKQINARLNKIEHMV